MKQYVIDGLRPEDHHRLKAHLDQHLIASPVDGIYWLRLKEDLLTLIQKEHADCRPHVVALTLENGSLSCELLVRTNKKIRCDCMGYAGREQRNWLMDLTDAILDRLCIRI